MCITLYQKCEEVCYMVTPDNQKVALIFGSTEIVCTIPVAQQFGGGGPKCLK
jgi:hypothetical protein